VIVFTGKEENGGISRAVFDVVEGRVSVESLELLWIFDGAEFGDVEGAVGIKFNTWHVIDADIGNDRAIEVGILGECRAHQEAAIAAAENGELSR
jgi:hypothetical protein